MADEDKMERAEKELLAIKLVVDTLKELDDESKRRVLGYSADLFGVNTPPRQPASMGMSPGPRMVRTPLPAGADSNAVRQAIDQAGLPRSR
jgi:hypothetical protein